MYDNGPRASCQIRKFAGWAYAGNAGNVFDVLKSYVTHYREQWHRWTTTLTISQGRHDDVTKWKHFPRNWPFWRGIHRSPVNSPHKGQWRGALMFTFICAWIKGWVNNREGGDLRRHRAHYDIVVTLCHCNVLYARVKQTPVTTHVAQFITHWGRDEMPAIFQTTFSNAFSWKHFLNCE